MKTPEELQAMLEDLKDGATLDPKTLQKVSFPSGYQVGLTNNIVKPENILKAVETIAANAINMTSIWGLWSAVRGYMV